MSTKPNKELALMSAHAGQLVEALNELGFGDDDDISGADTVDVINRYQALIRKLPELVTVAVAVNALVAARGRHHTGAEQEYRTVAAALTNLKGYKPHDF